MLLSQVHGTHEPNGGEALTLDELADLIKSIPKKARQNYVRIATDKGAEEISGIRFSQSDQAESHDFKPYLLTVKRDDTK